ETTTPAGRTRRVGRDRDDPGGLRDRFPGRASDLRDQTRSLSALSGRAFTTFRAGFALIMIGSLVNGLMPGFALVAGLRTTLSLSRPGIWKWPGPFLPSSRLIRSLSAENTLEICFFDRPVFSAIVVKTSALVADLLVALSLDAWAALESAALGVAFLAM